jgi:hypothetical protein
MAIFRILPCRRAPLALAALLGIAQLPPAYAGLYQALCVGGGECTVALMNGKISIPGLSIPAEDVLSWSQGGSGSKTDVGMGVGAVVLFGLPGIIGFGAKKHDYQYYINYVDASGNGQMAVVQFKNSVPANQFMMEMMGMTGLSMGELNKNAQARLKRGQSSSVASAAVTEQTTAPADDCAPVLRTYNCSWSKYLDANVVARKWAQANSSLVPAEKARLRAQD